MKQVSAVWYTGEHGQQLEQDQRSHRRQSKLPPATQRAVDDINERYPGDLNDDMPEL